MRLGKWIFYSLSRFQVPSTPTFETGAKGDEFAVLTTPFRSVSVDDPDSRSHSNFRHNGSLVSSETCKCTAPQSDETHPEELPARSKGQEMFSSPWDAAKHMESAVALAKEVGNWNEVSDFYKQASELYIQCGRAQPVLDALAKGACALEDALPDEPIKIYTNACVVLEDDGKEQMTFDLYRAATNVYVKLEKYTDAATFLLKWPYQLTSEMLLIASARLILVQLLCIFMRMTSSRQRNVTMIVARLKLY
ncbi:UNVERIFIED_CONTAM: Gamma-soluble NSF attachment protein [Sesamum radiatum]|uniref:Gamma-soluble NSF attachment protein n=1 Tax=Sesamum radiatum TaxID=300843 RepID=A0AAW2TSJ0_SESRA